MEWLVVLLDYSAAFDTVDHSIVLDLLERRCGLTDDALRWHTSYLYSRSYAIVPGGATSETVDLDSGLPQAPSLGPLKFIVYAADLHAVTRHHNVRLHRFADDAQLYTTIRDVQLAN